MLTKFVIFAYFEDLTAKIKGYFILNRFILIIKSYAMPNNMLFLDFIHPNMHMLKAVKYGTGFKDVLINIISHVIGTIEKIKL